VSRSRHVALGLIADGKPVVGRRRIELGPDEKGTEHEVSAELELPPGETPRPVIEVMVRGMRRRGSQVPISYANEHGARSAMLLTSRFS
jgi:hypothetical protein